jgi:hypothetical protein
LTIVDQNSMAATSVSSNQNPAEQDGLVIAVIPGRPKACSRAYSTRYGRQPGIHKPRPCLWIPGPALTRRTGMTTTLDVSGFMESMG